MLFSCILISKETWRYQYMGENGKNNEVNDIKWVGFSKDNPIIEVSSKQEHVQIQNIQVPVRPKEIKQKK